MGELFGHWFNDFIANGYIRRSGGAFEPEVRLWTTYISSAFMIAALVIYGFGIERHWQWIALIMAWAMYSFGIVTATVAITGQSQTNHRCLPFESVSVLTIQKLTLSMSFLIMVSKQLPSSTSFVVQAASLSTTSRSTGHSTRVPPTRLVRKLGSSLPPFSWSWQCRSLVLHHAQSFHRHQSIPIRKDQAFLWAGDMRDRRGEIRYGTRGLCSATFSVFRFDASTRRTKL